jgi:hypothetical protein
MLLLAGALGAMAWSGASAHAQQATNTFSVTWQSLTSLLGATPANVNSTSVDNNPTVLPSLETLLQEYYTDHSESALTQIQTMLQQAFPNQSLPTSAEMSFSDLVKSAASDPQLQLALTNLCVHISSSSGSTTQTNLWSSLNVQSGPAMDSTFATAESYAGIAPTSNSYSISIVEQSFAPSPPHIVKAVESTITLGDIAGAQVVVPAAKIVFSPTAMDKLSLNDPSVHYFYRLWLYGNASSAKLSPINPSKSIAKGTYNLQIVMSGTLGGTKITDPKPETDANGNPTNSGYYQFLVPVPAAGLNQYSIDCIKIIGGGSLISQALASDLNKLTPWFSGELDNITLVNPAAGQQGETFINPALGFLQGDNVHFEVGELSDPASVYITGQASGLSQFGRIDLAADPSDISKIYMSIPSFRTSSTPQNGSGMIFRYDSMTAQIASKNYNPGFMTPGQSGLALGQNHSLYVDNSASDAEFGGRLFRMTGFYEASDTPYAPPYPTPPYTDGNTHYDDALPARSLVGSVNYFSMLNGYANPTSVQQIALGKNEGDAVGQQLYVADASTNTIKKVAVQRGELSNWDPSHVVGQPWASSNATATPPPNAADQLAFNATTDLAFSGDWNTLYISQGSYVVKTTSGVNASRSITTGGGSLFNNATGVATCQDAGKEYLFVADSGTGSILRIPVSDIPIAVPSDPQQLSSLVNKYTFLTGLSSPGEIRITDGYRAMVFVDNNNLYYQHFGFAGKAVDASGNPLSGAVVTADTADGTISTTTDSQGNYSLVLDSQQSMLLVHITSPSYSYSEFVNTTGRCNSNTSGPCVDITSPADGSQLSSSTVMVTGTIFPLSTDFTASGGTLQVNGTDSYPLVFTGNHNDFTVSNVNLSEGENTLAVFTNPVGTFQNGGSLPITVTLTQNTITTQAYSGVATDSNGNPVSDKTVTISVNGVQAASTTTSGCGYYNAQNLPLGTVTAKVAQ